MFQYRSVHFKEYPCICIYTQTAIFLIGILQNNINGEYKKFLVICRKTEKKSKEGQFIKPPPPPKKKKIIPLPTRKPCLRKKMTRWLACLFYAFYFQELISLTSFHSYPPNPTWCLIKRFLWGRLVKKVVETLFIIFDKHRTFIPHY